MKNDLSFKLLAAVILAGVVLAFVTPSHAAPASRTRDRTGTYQDSSGARSTRAENVAVTP